MKKISTKKAAAAKKVEDLVVKDGADVTGGAASGGDRPTESLSLNFTKVVYK
jgi:hypothetical protein